MLKVENLIVNYGGIEAVKGISLDVPDGSITHLEFTTRDGGFVTISGEKHQFRYETAGDGINSTFYLYYEGEKYLGRIHYCKNGPGIQLYNPQMDGTFGPFKAQ